MKILKRISLFVVLVLLAGYLLISWSLSKRVVTPTGSFEDTKEEIRKFWGTTYEEIMAGLPVPESFDVQSFDELTIKGKYFQLSDSSTCAIIFAHGWSENWPGMLKYAPLFDSCQCDLVFYDHRAHGESGGKYATGTVNEAKDLLSVTRWANQQKGFAMDQIAWVGCSWGAATSLVAGATDEDVAFIIADSPFQDWYSAVFERALKEYGAPIKLLAGGIMKAVGIRAKVNTKEASPLLKAKEIKEPVLLIHSMADSATAYQQSVNISKQLNKQSEVHFTKWGNPHVKDVVYNLEECREIVNSFIARKKPGFLKREKTLQ